MEFAYVNGKIVPAHKAVLSIFDRGLVLGDGLFETLKAVDYVPEFYKEHYSRLKKSAKRLKLHLPVSEDGLLSIINTLCKKSKLKMAVVRITLTRGMYTGGLAIDPTVEPSLMVSVREVPAENKRLIEKGVNVAVSSINKIATSGLDPQLKSTNYLANIFAKAEADQKGCYEAILLGEKGEIAELSTASFFVVIKGRVYTPPIDTGILPGITRQQVLKLLQHGRLDFQEKKVFLKEMPKFEEAFLTSSVRGVIPIVKIDKKMIGEGRPGVLTKKLWQMYIDRCGKNRLKCAKSIKSEN